MVPNSDPPSLKATAARPDHQWEAAARPTDPPRMTHGRDTSGPSKPPRAGKWHGLALTRGPAVDGADELSTWVRPGNLCHAGRGAPRRRSSSGWRGDTRGVTARSLSRRIAAATSTFGTSTARGATRRTSLSGRTGATLSRRGHLMDRASARGHVAGPPTRMMGLGRLPYDATHTSREGAVREFVRGSSPVAPSVSQTCRIDGRQRRIPGAGTGLVARRHSGGGTHR